MKGLSSNWLICAFFTSSLHTSCAFGEFQLVQIFGAKHNIATAQCFLCQEHCGIVIYGAPPKLSSVIISCESVPLSICALNMER